MPEYHCTLCKAVRRLRGISSPALQGDTAPPDIDKFMNGEYCIQELLYRGTDGRLYTFETGEPVETVPAPGPE